jgi:class 3 adenylate cyclase
MRRAVANSLPKSWLNVTPGLKRLPDGDWLATYLERPEEGVLLKLDGTCIPFFGALGKMVPGLNWLPASREYFLGSSFHGRYQLYDRGLATWESIEGGGDVGHPVARWESLDKRARQCRAIIAFLDLRGFTNWSQSQDPKQVQDTIENFERCFQNAFSKPWCQRLFAKGTGDGVMVVSEAGYFAPSHAKPDGTFHERHIQAFCLACAETVAHAKDEIPSTLAVGCGVTIGSITQFYILGRCDYIGPAVNAASRLQSAASGDLNVSPETFRNLHYGGAAVEPNAVSDTGVRIAAETLIAAFRR